MANCDWELLSPTEKKKALMQIAGVDTAKQLATALGITHMEARQIGAPSRKSLAWNKALAYIYKTKKIAPLKELTQKLTGVKVQRVGIQDTPDKKIVATEHALLTDTFYIYNMMLRIASLLHASVVGKNLILAITSFYGEPSEVRMRIQTYVESMQDKSVNLLISRMPDKQDTCAVSAVFLRGETATSRYAFILGDQTIIKLVKFIVNYYYDTV